MDNVGQNFGIAKRWQIKYLVLKFLSAKLTQVDSWPIGIAKRCWSAASPPTMSSPVRGQTLRSGKGLGLIRSDVLGAFWSVDLQINPT